MEEELALSTPRIDLVLQYLQDRCTPLLCSFKKQIEQQHKSSFCLLNGNVAFFWRAHHKLLILAIINLHLTPVCIGVFASCQFLGLFLSPPSLLALHIFGVRKKQQVKWQLQEAKPSKSASQ